jgi:DNA (cytosine-5)-methyltransferase 1
MNNYIPVIDLFAGPGGLGEGFSAFCDTHGNKPFKIALSIEKDVSAHKTLELRSFFREFSDHEVTEDYYDYLRGNISRDKLFEKHPKQASKAKTKAWLCELGKGNPSNDEIDQRIETALYNKNIWVLIGGPPCQAYSIVGRSRRKNENITTFESDKRHFLYKEYLRIVAMHKPPIFIMENVKGILSSKINGSNIFNKILDDLKHPNSALSESINERQSKDKLEYRIFSLVKPIPENNHLLPTDYIIKAENYDIPQRRHRVILLGIRSDISLKPNILPQSSNRFSVQKAISDLPKLRSGISKEPDSANAWKSILEHVSKSTWLTDNHVSPELNTLLCETTKQISSELTMGTQFQKSNTKPNFEKDWFFDGRLQGVCNHTSRKHMRSDLYRYYFSACFAKMYNRSPQLADFPEELLPKHKNVNKGVNGELFSDRFRVQIANAPSTTITSHISKDGHYYIHPDPTQCRSLTVREAARLQTFPDNYYFEGNQTLRYQQVGNAVPPLLALKIAQAVYEISKYIIS